MWALFSLTTMTSCGFYSAKYLATYTLQNTKNNEDIKEVSINFINNLANKNSLSKDTRSRYNDTDTFAFFGRSYHYFKFWFEQKENDPVLKLDYWGMYGSRKKIHYAGLFNELNVFLNENFTILEQEIKAENNAKDRK